MSRRGLRRTLALAGLAFMLQPGSRARDLARAATAPRATEFDSLVVAPARFSPNGDGRLDEVRASYRLTARETLTLVATTRVGDTVRVVARDTVQDPGGTSRVFFLSWDGRSAASGPVVPDGAYVLHLTGRAGGVVHANEREVQVDTRRPIAEIESVDPPILVPHVPNGRSVARFGVRVQGADLGDSLHVVLRVPSPARAFRLRLQQPAQDLQGDGLYWAVCDSCSHDRAVPDGRFPVEAATSDVAGNTDTSEVAWLDKDIKGPRPAVKHPVPGTVAYVQHADSLTGSAYDRHKVHEVRMRIAGGSSVVLPGAVPPGDSVFAFHTDISTQLAAEGRYSILLRGQDPYGVTDSLRYLVVVDRTPPGRPRLEPRPGPVSKTQTLEVTLAVDPADAPYQIIRSGGALPADTTHAGTSGLTPLLVQLHPGANALSFAARDSALNVSPPETLTVVWDTSRGLAAPERFAPGTRFQLDVGSQPGNGVEVRIFATDGSLVKVFEDPSSKLVYEFTWDLRNPNGKLVKNGAYLLQARVRNADGSEERWRQLIAVLE